MYADSYIGITFRSVSLSFCRGYRGGSPTAVQT